MPAHSDSSSPIDLSRVRTLFERRRHPDDAEFLFREIAARMHERLSLVRLDPRHVLDAGCGRGQDLPALQQLYPQAAVFGLDAALNRLSGGRQAEREAGSSLQRLLRRLVPAGVQRATPTSALVCGDFARLPLASAALDLLWSNLALHWHHRPDLVLDEWRRVLKVDGLLMFSCFGPDTLKELRAAFSGLDDCGHVLDFVDMHDFGDMLVNAGFSTPVMDMEVITVTYSDSARLFQDVRALGGNPLLTRRDGLIGREAWNRVLDSLGAERDAQGKLRLTFEVIYGHAFRPAPRKTAAGESIVRLDLGRK